MYKKYIKYLISGIVFLSFSLNLFCQEDQPQCTSCHKKLIADKIVHAAAEDCSTCHESNGNKHPLADQKGFKLSDKIPDLCYMCHDRKDTKKHVHPPAEEGECIMCHSPHSSPNKFLLTEKPVSKLCFECHDLEIPQTDIMHQHVKQGKCNECHDPHQSDNDKFLIEKKPKLCFTCHKDKEKEAKMENIHPPFEDDCANCHNPHSSPVNNLLIQKTPDLCFNCHDGFADAEKSKSVHNVIFDKKNCINCHSPHASNNSKLLIAKNNDLCFSCHNKKIKTGNKTIENIYYKIKNGKSVHAPIELDGCGACHLPHFSDNNYLLNLSYPNKRYVEAKVKNFALCFECHDSSLLTDKNTTTGTNFRNGNENLHFLHINGDKGRNCNLCHDLHASQNEHLIREKANFGNWEMNLNYKPVKTGGSCFPGCHGKKEYIR
ncbi:MAG: cytochrome c3 family protein [Bacteroidales bacterium]|nr:cytochrome c3 family protein [Bacteroidales bacterium]